MMKQWIAGALCTVAAFGAACEKLDHAPEKYLQDPPPTRQISLEEVAQLLSSLPIGTEQLSEVHGAVSSSEGNGYDSEYRMMEVFRSSPYFRAISVISLRMTSTSFSWRRFPVQMPRFTGPTQRPGTAARPRW